MYEPCHDPRPLGDEARLDERDTVLDRVCRSAAIPGDLLDLLVRVGGYGHLGARGPGVECESWGDLVGLPWEEYVQWASYRSRCDSALRLDCDPS